MIDTYKKKTEICPQEKEDVYTLKELELNFDLWNKNKKTDSICKDVGLLCAASGECDIV